MRSLLWSVAALIVSFSALLAGNSLQFVVLGLRGGIEGFGVQTMGWVTTAYFAGFAAGSILCPRIVASAGHIRTFAALASIVSGVALGHALLPAPIPWIMMRLVTGFCFAGLFLVVESWLNARAGNEQRGRLLAVYGIAAFGGYATGPLLVWLAPPDGFELFVIASITVSFALVPVTLTRASAPILSENSSGERLGLLRLFRDTPLGIVGVALVGSAQATFMGLAPSFGDALGLDARTTSLFITGTLAAGLTLQYPIGWLSDRLDRRLVIAGLSVLGATGFAASAILLQPGQTPPATLALLALISGAGILPMYAVVLAYTNDRMPRDSLVAAAAALILAYSLGSIAAPPLASLTMQQLGPAGMYVFLAGIMALLGGFAGFRMLVSAAPAAIEEAQVATTAVWPGTIPLDPDVQADQLEYSRDA